MRFALVSDIHGNLPALEAVVADIRRQGVDQIINLGDSLSGPLMPRETAQYLMATDWVHLAGNHERQLLTIPPERQGASDAFAHAQLGGAELAWLSAQTHCQQWTPDVFLCHGSPRSDVEYLLETVIPNSVRLANAEEVKLRLAGHQSPVIACGHTHIPRSVRLPSGCCIVNPGSVGLQAYDDARPYPHWVENGTTDARYALVEKLNSGWTASIHSIPYNFMDMARLAERRGRPDWEIALRTGFMQAANRGQVLS